jgi:hypothetical protein
MPKFVYSKNLKEKNMNNLIIKKSQIVEAQFQNSVTIGQKYPFTEIPNLSQNNIILYGIECFCTTQLITTPSNNTVIAAADVPRIIVTFRNINKEEFVYQMPIYTLIRANNGGFIVMFKPQLINLTDCYIQTMSVGTIAVNQSVAFNFYYDLVS